jgi:hypothetical protein
MLEIKPIGFSLEDLQNYKGFYYYCSILLLLLVLIIPVFFLKKSNHHPFKKYNDYPLNTNLMLFPPSLDRYIVVFMYILLYFNIFIIIIIKKTQRIAAIESYFQMKDMRKLNFVAP